MEKIDFLRALFSPQRDLGEDQNVGIFEMPSKLNLYFPLADLYEGERAESLLSDLHDAKDLYINIATRVPGLTKYQRGVREQDLVYTSTVVLDVDILDPSGHKSGSLPKTRQEAEDLLGFRVEPSAVVYSGGGYHYYWFLEEAISLRADNYDSLSVARIQQWQNDYIAKFRQSGLTLDNTAHPERVFRLPCTKNYKYTPARDVELLEFNPECRYPLKVVCPTPGTVRGLGAQTIAGSVSAQAEHGANPFVTEFNGDLAVWKNLLDDLCKKYIEKNKSHKDVKKRARATALEQLLDGGILASPGNRDNMLNSVTSLLVYIVKGAGYHDAPPSVYADYLEPVLRIWASEEGALLPLSVERKKVIAQATRAEKTFDKKEREKLLFKKAFFEAAGFIRSDKDEEYIESLDAEGVDSLMKRAEQRYIMQYKTDFYIWSPKALAYQGPYVESSVLQACKTLWDEGVRDPENLSGHSPTTLMVAPPSKEGQEPSIKQKAISTIKFEYVSVAKNLEQVLSAAHTKVVEKSHNIIIQTAPCPMAVDLKPEYNEVVDKFFRGLAPEEHREHFLDWLTGFAYAEDHLSMLYLEGRAGIGKTVLASGLSRLWSREGQYTKALDAFGENNQKILSCPFIFVDEKLPKKVSGEFTEQMREMTGASQIRVIDKYVASSYAKGYLRLMAAANNDQALSAMSNSTSFSPEDLEAILKRILYIKAPRSAVDFFSTLSQDEKASLIKMFVEEGAIAKQVLWYKENRSIVNKGDRLLVDGNDTEFHKSIQSRGLDDTSQIAVDWVCWAASLDPRLLNNNAKGLCFWENGDFYVSHKALEESWVSFDTTGNKLQFIPRQKAFGESMRSQLRATIIRKVAMTMNRQDRKRFHKIKGEHLLLVASYSDEGSTEAIKNNIENSQQ